MYRKNDVLHLGTVGHGHGADTLRTAANHVVGMGYSGGWQAGVEYNADPIRKAQSPKP